MTDLGQRTELMRAIEAGPTEDVALQLLDGRVEVHARDRWGNTALHYAAVWGADQTAKRLIELGADARCATEDDGEEYFKGVRTPLEVAAAYGHSSVLRVLLGSSRIPWQTSELFKVLLAACRIGYVPQALFEHVIFDELQRVTALACAVHRNREHAVATLVNSREATLKLVVDGHMAAALRGASSEDHSEMANSGNDPARLVHALGYGETGTVGEAMVFFALSNEFYDLSNLLLRRGADPGFGPLVRESLHSPDKPFGVALKTAAFAQATTMLPAGFLTAPGTVLYASLLVCEAALRASSQVKVKDPPRARALKQLADRAELMPLALLHTLPEDRQSDILYSNEGEEFVRKAADLQSIVVLGLPMLQQNLSQRWHGDLLIAILHSKGVGAWGAAVPVNFVERAWLVFITIFLVLPSNIIALLVLAVVPQVEPQIVGFLQSLGEEGELHGGLMAAGYNATLKPWWQDLYVLNVPFVKCSLQLASNIALCLLIVTEGLPKAALVTWSASLWYTLMLRICLHPDRIFMRATVNTLLIGATLICTGLSLEISLAFPQDQSNVNGITGCGVLLVSSSMCYTFFLQSATFGPMLVGIANMVNLFMVWFVLLTTVVFSFTVAYLVKTDLWDKQPDPNDPLGMDVLRVLRHLFVVAIRVSPLIGSKPLVQEQDEDELDFMFLNGYWLITTPFMSLLTALFSTRLVKGDDAAIPTFYKSFSRLVLDQHLRGSVPPPLQPLSIPATIISSVMQCLMNLSTEGSKAQQGPKPKLGRVASSYSMAEMISTPEKRWHTLDYTRKWNGALP